MTEGNSSLHAIREFEKQKNRQQAVAAILFLGILIILVPVPLLSKWPQLLGSRSGLLLIAVLVLIGLLITAGAVIFGCVNWRCPACKRFLGEEKPRFCKRCGVQLVE